MLKWQSVTSRVDNNRVPVKINWALLLGVLGLVAVITPAAAAQDLTLTEEEKKILRESGNGALIDTFEKSQERVRQNQLALGRQLKGPGADGRAHETMGFWLSDQSRMRLKKSKMATGADTRAFEQMVATNLKLFYAHEEHVAYCLGTPHKVSDVGLEAVQPTGWAEGGAQEPRKVNKVRIHYRVTFGSPVGDGTYCGDRTQSMSTEWIRVLDGSWFSPDWSLYLIELIPDRRDPS